MKQIVNFRLIPLAIVTLAAFGGNVVAQEFRIETDIYVDQNQKPVSENLTLFNSDAVFDFQLAKKSETPVEVIIYNFSNKKFVLLDPSRKVKYEVDQEKLEHFVKSMRNDTAFRKRMPFLFEPEFQKTYDSKSGWLSLKSEPLQYRCRGEKSSNEKAMSRYFEFIDQCALLNVTDPKKLPPFARLELNKAIKENSLMPKTVEMQLTIPGSTSSRKIQAKSKHFVIWKLSKTDNSRIENAKQMIQQFRSVGIEEYRQLNRVRTAQKNQD